MLVGYETHKNKKEAESQGGLKGKHCKGLRHSGAPQFDP